MLVSFPRGNAGGNTGYDLSLVAASGKTVAHAHAAARTFIPGNPSDLIAMPLPEVTASRTRAYYLDGDADVHYLGSDGSTALVTHVPGTATAYAAFSVSPDDKRIAVSVFDFAQHPLTVRLYVEDITGSNHAEIFSSSSDYVWPVGWHAGQLVLAASVGRLYGIAGNPYRAPAYHVVDPSTGDRLTSLGGDPATNCAPMGPLTSAGTACWTRPGDTGPAIFTTLDWSGHQGSSQLPVTGVPGAGALSADGTELAACCDSDGTVSIVIPGGARFSSGLPGQDGICWVDSGHLYNGPEIPSTGTPRILDLRRNMGNPSGALSPIDATGFCAGLLPQDFG